MNYLELVALVGSVASLAGVVIAWIQTIRLKNLRKGKKADNWLALREILSLIRGLEATSLEEFKDESPAIHRAYSKAKSIHRQILKQIVLEEKIFDQSTIQGWLEIGKIEESWQVNEARIFLEPKRKNIYPILDKNSDSDIVSNNKSGGNSDGGGSGIGHEGLIEN